jgi:hypothetical protein
MRIIITLIFLAVATASSAATYMWQDENGTHFTDNANSIPKKYRAKALAEPKGDITTTDPDVEQSVDRSRSRARAKNLQDEEATIQSANEKKQRLDAENLAKTDCTGDIPGECGPGRRCVYKPLIKHSGVCKSQAEADRIVSESKQRMRDLQQQQRDWNLDRKLDDIKDKADSIDRQLKWGY